MADFSLVAELKANTSDFISGIKKGEESLKGFGGIVDKILGPKGKLVMAIATATTAALKLGQSMNKAMAEVAKGTGATGKELEKFRGTLDQVLEKGVNSSTKEIAKVMADVNTRFKLTGEELANLTVDFDKFATVTEIDVKNSVEEVADVLAKWNIETEDATGLMDQLVVASQDTGVSVETLLGELKQGQAIFSQLGMSATDTIAYLGTLKENGIDSSVALTGLRTALAKWSQEGKNAQQEFKLVAEKIKNAKTETEALNISVANFGARSGAEMVKVLRNSANGADELKDKLIAAGGAVERTAEATRTSKEAFKVLGDTLKESFGGLFEGFDNLFKGLADTLNNLFNILKPLLMPLFNVVEDILTMVGNVLSNLTSEIQIYVTKYSMGFNAMVAATNSAYQFIHSIMGYLEESFGTVFGFIFSLLEGRFGLAWEYLKKNLLINVKFILDIVSKLVNAVKDQLNTLIEKGVNPIIEKINWAQEKLGKKKTEKLSLIENFDLSGITGIDQKIEDVSKKIEELSGKSKKKIVGDLGEVNHEYDNVSVSVQRAGREQKDWNSLIRKQEIEIAGINEDYKKQLDLQLWAIENERQSALSSATSAEERAEINKYYDNEIYLARKKIRKKDEKEEKKSWQALMKSMLKAGVDFSKNIAKVFKNIAGTIKNVFEKIGSVVKSAFSGIFSIIKKLVSFSIDDALDSLLEFEDGILTFFVETLPKLPQFIESAFGSVISLLETLDSVIDFDKLERDLSSMINTISDKLPNAFENASSIFTKIFDSLSTAIQENAPQIVSGFGSMFFTVAEALPGIIDNLFATIGSLLSELGKYLTANKDRFETALKNIISSIVNGISEFVKTGGWRNLLQGLLAVQQAIENAVADNIEEIGNTIVSLLPDLMDFLKKSIVSASKTFGRIAPTLFKIIVEIIVGIIDVITSDEVIESSLEAIEGLIEGLVPAVVKIFTKVLPQLIEFSLIKLPSYTPMIITHVITGLIKGFAEVDWLQTIKDIFNGFVEGFKDFFGIHSPSTLFEGFGTNIIEGLVIGLQGFADAVKTILEPIFKFINDGFGKVLDTIAELTKISFDGFNEGLSDILDAVTKLLNPVDTLKATFDGLKTLLDSVSDLMKTSAKITISILGAVVKAIADVHNELRDIIKSVTTIKVWTPWKTYEIGGVDIGKVSSPNIDSYLDIVDKLATGTNNARKGLTLVGEAGPELVNFRGGEQVYNNHNTEKMLAGAGGNTNNFNVTFQNTQDTTAFAMLQQLKAYNRQMAINGVL